MWQTCGASVEFVISAGHGVAERPAPGGPLPAALLSQTHSNDFFVRCSLMKPHFVYRCAKFSQISISYHNMRHVVSTLRFRLLSPSRHPLYVQLLGFQNSHRHTVPPRLARIGP